MRTVISFLVVLMIAFSGAISAQSVMDGVQKKFDRAKDVRVDFVQTANGKSVSGKFYYKTPRKQRIELSGLLIVTDGATSWNYNQSQKRVVVSKFNDADPNFLAITDIVNTYPPLCTVTESGRNITFVPKPGTKLNFRNAEMKVQTDNTIEQLQITDMNNQLITIRFSGYQFDSNLTDAIFTFKPSEGMKVIDLR